MTYGRMRFFPSGYVPDGVRHRDIDTALRLADAQRQADVTALTLLGILRKHPEHSFVTLEKRLRALGGQAHLVAYPVTMAPPPCPQAPHGYTARDLHGQELPYYLWVCSFGAAEAREMLARLGVTPVENLARLERTGVMSIKG